MKKKYEEMTVGEGLITALEQAVDYETGKKIDAVKSTKISIAPPLHCKTMKTKSIARIDERMEEGVSSAWDVELENRVGDIQAGRVTGIPAEEVFAEIKEKYH